jgi:hypothetical protein
LLSADILALRLHLDPRRGNVNKAINITGKALAHKWDFTLYVQQAIWKCGGQLPEAAIEGMSSRGNRMSSEFAKASNFERVYLISQDTAAGHELAEDLARRLRAIRQIANRGLAVLLVEPNFKVPSAWRIGCRFSKVAASRGKDQWMNTGINVSVSKILFQFENKPFGGREGR